MVSVKIILENSDSIDKQPGKHGVAIQILFNGTIILYDFGPKGCLSKYCKRANVALETFDFAVLSHSHVDHGGGLSEFLKNNSTSKVYCMDGLHENIFAKVLGIINLKVGINPRNIDDSRIICLKETTEIKKNIYLVKLSEYKNKSRLNTDLRERINGVYSQDTFRHESALVIDDNNELVVFSSCSHHGVSNIISDIKAQFPEKKIRAFVGGFHMGNPINNQHEPIEYILYEAEQMINSNATFYTGHCTGEFAFAALKSKMKEKLIRIRTKMSIEV